MTRISGRLVTISGLLVLVAIAGVVLALQAQRTTDARAAAEAQNAASRQESAEFASALAAIQLPRTVAAETPRVDGCAASVGSSRCWTSAQPPSQVAAALKRPASGLKVESVTQRDGIPGSGGDYTLTITTDNGEKLALSVIGRNRRDQSQGEGPTIWSGSVIQALPTSS